MPDPIEQNIQGVQSLVSSKTNKVERSTGPDEGVIGEPEDVLTLKMSDKKLLDLAQKWTNTYRLYEGGLKPRWEANKAFYLGRQQMGSPTATQGEGISANLIFEAEETFLPAALSKNPEPVVWSDNTEQGTKLSTSVKTMLQYHADTQVLRRKLTLMTRHWSIYFLGIIKHGWDANIQDITSDVRNPENFVFNPEGYIDCYGDYVGYLGERIKVTAERLIELFPKHRQYIIVKVDGKLGSSVTYTEWWSDNDEFFFYTFEKVVLDKGKNPHFNYDEAPETAIELNEETGEEEEIEVSEGKKANNHFAKPKKPYTFLSVFSLGKQPHDETGLIEQNIPNQRRITRRTDQLDYNLSRANNSDVFSADNFNQETAKQAAQALAKGNPILVPSGKDIGQAIARLQSPSVGADFFRELEISKNDLRTIFGTNGITAQPQNEDQTARGLILNQSHDTSRIGGGIGDAIEQVADNIFNWWVQLYYVYYDSPHEASIIGQKKAIEYETLSSQNLDRRIVVSVSPDSMKPKDEITQMNQAMALYEKGALDPKTLLTMLDVPDPQTTAESAVLWLLDKQAYLALNFPELAAKLQERAQQQAMAQQQALAQAGGGEIAPEQVAL
jgi:hypothetical protein